MAHAYMYIPPIFEKHVIKPYKLHVIISLCRVCHCISRKYVRNDQMTKNGHQEFWVENEFFSKKGQSEIWLENNVLRNDFWSPKPKAKSPPMSLSGSRPTKLYGLGLRSYFPMTARKTVGDYLDKRIHIRYRYNNHKFIIMIYCGRRRLLKSNECTMMDRRSQSAVEPNISAVHGRSSNTDIIIINS